jgi:hypothetical protein
MSRRNPNFRLQLERLEGRDAPAVVAPAIVWPVGAGEAVHVAPNHDSQEVNHGTGSPQAAAGDIDQVPLRISLTAVIVIALGVGWDRHIRERRPALRGKFTQMLSAS